MIDPVLSAQTAQNIADTLFADCQPELRGQPVVYAMAGIPGAGKSTFVKMALQNRYFPKTGFILNPDMVMDLIPTYHEDVRAIGAEDAFVRWEMPARNLAYDLVRQAGDRRIPIIKDMGMVRAENWRMLMELRAKGYRIILHHIQCDAEEAVRRCATRERHFPAQRIYERARELDALMADFAGIADEMVRFDNSDLDNPFIPLSSQKQHRHLKSA